MEANFASDDNRALHLLNDANWLFFVEGPNILFGRHDIPAYLDCAIDVTLILQLRQV
jgi:hypothetical protein